MDIVGIYGKTIDVANAMLEVLMEEIREDDILQFHKYKSSGNILYTKDGSMYEALTVCERRRGYNFLKVFIDKDIPIDMIENLIYPYMPYANYFYY